MLDRDQQKLQQLVDLIQQNKPAAPAASIENSHPLYIKKQAPDPQAAPPAPESAHRGAAPTSHVHYGATVFNIHPGASIGPITTIHHYPELKKDNHGN